MTDLRKAAEMALEALEGDSLPFQLGARAALRQALAQPEQEPVAWMHNFIVGNVITHKPVDIGRNPERWTALYSEPKPCHTCEALARTVMMDQTSHDTAPPKREWVGLTDEEIISIGNTAGLKAKVTSKGIIIHPEGINNFYRTIEAKLKEKNESSPD